MAILGTKKFWKPFENASNQARDNQILKNSGYINIQLKTVNYMSKGNFWQNTFGGKDKIVLATSLKYQSGVETIEATSVQDVREVKINNNFNLGIQRNIAVKVPANADALAIEVKLTAVKNDALQAKFDMLNKPEYQAALQLAPTVVGQVLTITSLVKGLFTDSDPDAQLEASFAGVISSTAEANPVENGKITKGLLIMISTNEGELFTEVDEEKFELRGDSLYYDDSPVENTYLVFNISFDQYKGDSEYSNWFKKYTEALNNLDRILLVDDQDEINKIFVASKNQWIEGNALIDADATYVNREKIAIKSAVLNELKKKYADLTHSHSQPPASSPVEILKGLTGSNPMEVINEALPNTGSFIMEHSNLDPKKPLTEFSLEGLKGFGNEFESLFSSDATNYLNDLKKENVSFNLNIGGNL